MKILSLISLAFSTFALVVAVWTLRLKSAPPASAAKVTSESSDTSRRLHEVETRSAELLSRFAEIEKRYPSSPSAIASAVASVVTSPALPLPTNGLYTVERDAVVYSRDTTVRFGANSTVSSPSGVMVSDLEQKMIVGDLAMETPNGTVKADGAVIDVTKQTVTAKRMNYTPK